jgi:tripartite-type tricarboxylate transporter receptor subunit TctC
VQCHWWPPLRSPAGSPGGPGDCPDSVVHPPLAAGARGYAPDPVAKIRSKNRRVFSANLSVSLCLDWARNALFYDVTKDFEPVSLFASNPLLIVAKNAVPADDLKGLIAWLKANPGKASQGHPGVGSPGHIGGVLFQNMTNTSFQFVP